MANGSLQDVLRRKTLRMSGQQLQRCALQIAQGMCYLHGHAPTILHKDLTTPNILVDANFCCRISDFGISEVRRVDGSLTASQQHMYMTNIRWRAPEIRQGAEFTTASDVFSYGLVLWEIHTRETPLAALGPAEAYDAYVSGQRPEIPSIIPDHWRALIESCWSDDPAARPLFQEIVKRLEKIEGDLPGLLPSYVQYSTVISAVFSPPLLPKALVALKKQLVLLSGSRAHSLLMHIPEIAKVVFVAVCPDAQCFTAGQRLLASERQGIESALEPYLCTRPLYESRECAAAGVRAGAKHALVMSFTVDVQSKPLKRYVALCLPRLRALRSWRGSLALSDYARHNTLLVNLFADKAECRNVLHGGQLHEHLKVLADSFASTPTIEMYAVDHCACT
eukprot:TRINITY_DN4269_c0_g1_i2.p1 TRINITY_DN4269_c0_g1~~TRINITY_DN4269_c0_g1_i2.p1  ORF type:complete len:393 (-),score=98.89 TRINITY_DN4269_c0_g1_i2:53-1231(-)